jgi:hypothetical protein
MTLMTGVVPNVLKERFFILSFIKLNIFVELLKIFVNMCITLKNRVESQISIMGMD